MITTTWLRDIVLAAGPERTCCGSILSFAPKWVWIVFRPLPSINMYAVPDWTPGILMTPSTMTPSLFSSSNCLSQTASEPRAPTNAALPGPRDARSRHRDVPTLSPRELLDTCHGHLFSWPCEAVFEQADVPVNRA